MCVVYRKPTALLPPATTILTIVIFIASRFIGVILQTQFPVRLFNIMRCGMNGDLQQFVMIEFQGLGTAGFAVAVAVGAGVVVTMIRVGVGAVQFFFRVIKQINFGGACFIVSVGGWRFHFLLE